jgi:hypothetical protein
MGGLVLLDPSKEVPVKYLFLILSLLGFMAHQDTLPTSSRGALARAKAAAATSSSTSASTDLGPVSAFEDGLPIPRR